MELGDGDVVPCLSGPMGVAAILVRAHGDTLVMVHQNQQKLKR